MSQLKGVVRTLEVGFDPNGFPPRFVRYRGQVCRQISALPEFPYEDGQFEIVLMDGNAVSRQSVKEAHRVLRPEGRLFFVVPEKTSKQDGFTLPDIYKIVRDGFNIVEVERPRWRFFGFGERTITICAQKKNWKTLTNTYRPYVV